MYDTAYESACMEKDVLRKLLEEAAKLVFSYLFNRSSEKDSTVKHPLSLSMKNQRLVTNSCALAKAVEYSV